MRARVCAYVCTLVYIYLNRCVCLRARVWCVRVCRCMHACVGALTKNTIQIPLNGTRG